MVIEPTMTAVTTGDPVAVITTPTKSTIINARSNSLSSKVIIEHQELPSRVITSKVFSQHQGAGKEEGNEKGTPNPKPHPELLTYNHHTYIKTNPTTTITNNISTNTNGDDATTNNTDNGNGISDPSSPSLDIRLIRRRTSNRESARRVRARKAEQLKELQDKVNEYATFNAQLMVEKERWDHQKGILLHHFALLRESYKIKCEENIKLKEHGNRLKTMLSEQYGVDLEAVGLDTCLGD
jgi:hypothetical protein